MTMRLFSLIITFLCIFPITAAKQPVWVKSKPTAEGFYSGIGSAPLTSSGYEKQAKEKALADLTSEIQIVIENKSLLERLDENGEYSERYANDIRTRSKAWLEGYELVGTHNDGKDYWVYYRLDRKKYADLKKKKSEEASKLALDLWQKGNKAIKSGDLINAVQSYADGIKAIEPFGDMRLEVVADGTTMNIASELQYSLSSIFSRFQIQSTPDRIIANPYNSETSSLLIKVKSGEQDLTGIPLMARMDSGTAKISVSGVTDNIGHTKISVSDISAKPAHRTLTISPEINLEGIFDTPALEAISSKFLRLIRPLNIPVEVKDPGLKAIVAASDMQSAGLTKQIASFVSRNYFDITDNETDADLKFEVKTMFRKGDIISGEMYDMREYYTSASISVTDLNTKATITTAVIDDMRTLAPEKTSEAKARSDAQRQILKRIQKALDSQLISSKFKRRDKTENTDTDSTINTDQGNFCSEVFE